MTSVAFKPVASISGLALKRRDWEAGIGADETNVSRALGLTQLGASYFEVRPGEFAFPFHVHYQEDEIIFVLAGEGQYRFGSETYPVKAGDALSAPAGRAEYAHQLTNTGASTLKYICVSNLPEINVVEWPDHGVLRVNSRKPGGPARVRAEDAATGEECVTKPVMNIADVPLRESRHGDTFEAKVGSFGRTIGSTGIGVMLHVVEPGKKAFPFHSHHLTHELFVILEGEGAYRFGAESHPVKAGDVLAAPIGGAEHAHQLINTGTKTLKYLGISANGAGSDVAEYPDSGKFAVTSRFDWSTGKGGIRYIGRKEGTIDYWDGEK